MNEPIDRDSLDTFTRAYIEAALCWSIDDDDDHLDANYDLEDISAECLAEMVADCAKFQQWKSYLFTEENYDGSGEYSAEEIAGHDFWLTRNGHGAGFWDGDWKEGPGNRLTKAANSFGEVYLYVGDDGKIYS